MSAGLTLGRLTRALLLGGVAATLGACSLFSSSTAPKPAALENITPSLQARAPTRLKSLAPEIPGRATNPVPRTQLAHRPAGREDIIDESLTLIPTIRNHPRHLLGVKEVAGLV